VNRKDLQEISKIRTKEAKTLLAAGHFPGAYYLAGYAIECALKACIAKQIKRHEFPDKYLANDAWIHSIEKLKNLAGLDAELKAAMLLDRNLELNWAVAKDWKESSRYDASISQRQATDLYNACITRKVGILSWVKKRW
jgi:hypothetical protein